ncbi:MAG: hypothetical protein L6435_04150 [Anaerolineae bacterium]|nr:hypothetical protein [Anaerolineae bacterium]
MAYDEGVAQRVREIMIAPMCEGLLTEHFPSKAELAFQDQDLTILFEQQRRTWHTMKKW